jgi:NDP-4-keto-2,6-dideoxyhexose 3-C-methyltransferase
MYGPLYGYRSSLSQTMVRHLSDIVEEALAVAQPSAEDTVLDIGCNDGTLLKFYDGLDLRRIGIDPSSARFASSYPDDIELIVDFFSADRLKRGDADLRFKIITSIAMFYDIENPLSFMREIRSLLAPDGVWFSEQAYALSMIQNLAFDSICHEHITYYNLRQIEWLTARAGLKLLDVSLNDSNGASFRIAACRDDAPLSPNRSHIDAVLASEARFAEGRALANFSTAVEERCEHIKEFIHEVQARGKTIFGYGASTKGNVVLQHCGLSTTELPFIAEKHPGKYGRVTPATRIPIISEADARAKKPDYFLVLPWHFRGEIVRRESRFMQQGGALVFPLPTFEVVEQETQEAYPATAQDRKIA